MGALTSEPLLLREEEGTPGRPGQHPHAAGIAEEEDGPPSSPDRAAAFNREAGTGAPTPQGRPQLSSATPTYVPAEGPLVSALLAVGRRSPAAGPPVAIGGGTQARLFKGEWTSGPAIGMERYRGHGPTST